MSSFDYDFALKSVEQGIRGPLMTSQFSLLPGLEGAGYDFEIETDPEHVVEIITLRSPS